MSDTSIPIPSSLPYSSYRNLSKVGVAGWYGLSYEGFEGGPEADWTKGRNLGFFRSFRANPSFMTFAGSTIGVGFGAYALYESYQSLKEEGPEAAIHNLAISNTSAGLLHMGFTRGFRGSQQGALSTFKSLFTSGGVRAGLKAAGSNSLGAFKTLAGRTFSFGMVKGVGAAVFSPLNIALAGNYMLTRATIGTSKRYLSESLIRNYDSLGTGTAGSLAAFQTNGAWTSRQLSVQAINRSHLNARSALGNEAQYMHM